MEKVCVFTLWLFIWFEINPAWSYPNSWIGRMFQVQVMSTDGYDDIILTAYDKL
ncbi:MAG: hypothetical protein IPH77_17085 [Ignavibacteria bacterium]|nr:hypothetical protein [Ignavibacteria bacterium]